MDKTPASVIYKQDLPPAQRYAPIRYKRNLSTRGPGGKGLLFGAFGICVYGWYYYIQGREELMELNREEMYARVYMLPFLMAEEERDLYRREMAQVAREREIMKDVEGWNERRPVYSTDRYVRRSVWLGPQ